MSSQLSIEERSAIASEFGSSGCDRCDSDWCIHDIVAALNAGGIETVACCCGHGVAPGRIDLADGRVLQIHHSEPQWLGGCVVPGGAPLRTVGERVVQPA